MIDAVPQDKSASGKAGVSASLAGTLRALFLVVFVAGLGGLGYFSWQQSLLIDNLSSRQLIFEQDADSTLAEFGMLNSRIEALELIQESQEISLENQRELTDSLNLELANIRLGLNTGRTVSNQSWILSEAASQLRLAGQFLTLAGDIPTAISLYRSSDELLSRISDPAIVPIRALLATDLTRLNSLDAIDVQEIYRRLTEVSGRIAQADLSRGFREVNSQDAEIQDDASGDDAGGFFSSLAQWAGQFVIISRIDDETETAVITFEDSELLRQNILLLIEQAKLALLQSREAIFRESLADVIELAAQHISERDVQRQDIIDSLRQLQRSRIELTVPSLSNAEGLLRDLLAADTAGNAETGAAPQ